MCRVDRPHNIRVYVMGNSKADIKAEQRTKSAALPCACKHTKQFRPRSATIQISRMQPSVARWVVNHIKK